MMQTLLNIARREAERVVSRLAVPKTGIVSGYDPDTYAAKVRLQPEDVKTRWLPVRSPLAWNGWGLFCPPTPGDEVEVGFQEGGKQAGYVTLRAFGDRTRPLSVPAGEFWLVHRSGSLLRFHNDGSVELRAAGVLTSSATQWNHTGNVKVTGDVLVTGDITDRDGLHGTVAHIRDVYDTHTRGGIYAGGGNTAVPNQPL